MSPTKSATVTTAAMLSRNCRYGAKSCNHDDKGNRRQQDSNQVNQSIFHHYLLTHAHNKGMRTARAKLLKAQHYREGGHVEMHHFGEMEPPIPDGNLV
jgi:NADPH-dependent glutamate synthase beta subunit-like oxidoreductase